MRFLPSRPDLPRYAAAALSGASLLLVSPPVSIAAVHWFSFLPLLVALDPSRPRLNARLGYTCGFVAVFTLFFWLTDTITTFSNIPMALAVPIVMLFAAVWGLPYALLGAVVHPLRQRFGAGWVALFPAVWVAAEWLQPALFPYYQGVGQYRVPWVWQLASVFGAFGVSFLVILVNATLAETVLRRREGARPPWVALAAVTSLWLANLAFGAWRVQNVENTLAQAPVLRTSILQQDVTMVTRLQERGPNVLKSWLGLTRRAVGQDPDLVVWPEGSIYASNPGKGQYAEVLGELTRTGGFSLLLGGGTNEPDPFDVTRRTSWNSAYLFQPDGTVGGRYDKMVPLPFGEYLPWPFSYLDAVIDGVGNFRAGTAPTLFKAAGYSFTTPICYEAILESQMRVLMDADLFVNITNDAWFGDTAAPHQHAMLAAVHAVEFGRPMLRIAYTGVSMVVEPHGAIRHETRPYTEVADVVPIRMAAFDTPYRTWGRVFPWITTLVAVVSLVIVRTRPVTDRAAVRSESPGNGSAPSEPGADDASP